MGSVSELEVMLETVNNLEFDVSKCCDRLKKINMLSHTNEVELTVDYDRVVSARPEIGSGNSIEAIELSGLKEKIRIKEGELETLKKILHARSISFPDEEETGSAQTRRMGRRRMLDDSIIFGIFNEFKDTGTLLITGESFPHALKCLKRHGLWFPEDEYEVKILFDMMDSNQDSGLDFEEFKAAIYSPTIVELWAESLNLHHLLAECIPISQNIRSSAGFLRSVADFQEHDIHVITLAFQNGLKDLIQKAATRLKNAFGVMDKLSDGSNTISTKYAAFQMSGGSCSDFHKGIFGRVGSPNPNFMQTMENEHCRYAGCDVDFTTSNYHITTSPRKEWEIVAGRLQCPEKEMNDIRGKQVRFIRVLNSEVQKEFEEHVLQAEGGIDGGETESWPSFAAKQMYKKAKLNVPELWAVILYTGPMFMVYNSILRRLPCNLSEGQPFEKLNEERNLFSTTIFVLVSAVKKIAQATKLPEGLLLFCGLGGKSDFPDNFWKSDEYGSRGYLDWGFRSTTSNMEAALNYSGIGDGRNPLPTMLKILVGSIDRGALLRSFSQYPAECEYLWLPCSFIQPSGSHYLHVTDRGVVRVVPVRINANLTAQTTDEYISQKKSLHLASFRQIIGEINQTLENMEGDTTSMLTWASKIHWGSDISFQEMKSMILEQCEVVFDRHEEVTPEEYLNEEFFRSLVIEMLNCKMYSQSKACLMFEDVTQEVPDVFGLSLRSAHRQRVAFLEKANPFFNIVASVRPWGSTAIVRPFDAIEMSAALNLCKLKGIVKECVWEVNELGETPLLREASDGAGMETLKLLVQARANIFALNPCDQNKNALICAAQNGHVSTLSALYSLGYRSLDDEDDRNMTALLHAAHHGHAMAVEFLGMYGCNIEHRAKEASGWGAHDLAAVSGHRRAVEVLLHIGYDRVLAGKAIADDGGKVDFSYGEKPIYPGSEISLSVLVDLHLDICGTQPKYCKSIVEHHKRAQRIFVQGKRSPFLAAVYTGNSKRVRALLMYEINLNIRNSQYVFSTVPRFGSLSPQGTALHLAAEMGHQYIVQILLENRAEYNILDANQLSPLEVAHKSCRRVLQEVGADGWTALMIAAEQDDAEGIAIQALGWTYKEAELERREKHKQTALHIATKGCCVNSVRALLTLKADHAAVNDVQDSPLHIAVSAGNLEIIRALLEAKADSCIRNEMGLTPFQMARQIIHHIPMNTIAQSYHFCLKLPIIETGTTDFAITVTRP